MSTGTSTINYTELATSTQVQNTAAAIQARGIKVQVVDTPAQALEMVHQIIPAGAEIMTGGSQTLREIGLEEMLVSKKPSLGEPQRRDSGRE